MNEGWIKLYRKTNDNGILKDLVAWGIFSWLLINVDQDGKRKAGRFQICDELGIKPSTYYKALKRLQEKWGVIRVDSTHQYSLIQIVNWGKYQHSENIPENDGGMVVERMENESNTKQEYKNIRIKNNNIYSKSDDLQVIGGEINSLLKKFEPLNPMYTKLYSNKTERHALEDIIKISNYEWLSNLLDNLPELVKKPYFPTITKPTELLRKMGALKQALEREKNTTGTKSAVFKEPI